SGSAVAERPRDNPRLAPPGADLVPSIAPEWGASLTAIHSRSGFPEIDCIRHAIPGAVLAAAESRAETVGVSADRVLIACGAISEEDYVRAFAAGCHAPFESLAEVSRKDCPLSDERLIESAAAGLLPLQIDGRLVLTVAPRHTAARYLAEMTARADLKGIFRLTSARRLQDFVFKHCKAGIARRAVGELENLWPELSAAPRPRSKKRAFLSIAALAVAATALSLHGTTVAVDVMLAIIFLAWSVLRLFGCLMRPPARKRPARIADDQLPTYSIIAALYREAVSVEHLVSCLRQLDYPAEKLDIKLVIESDDIETQRAIERLQLGPPFEIIVAPEAGPRTKPKALNAALPFVHGAFTVVFDAEDRPERDQLRRALDMFQADSDLACVQARLTIDNTADSWLARLFTAEYAGQFDVFLPGLAELRMPLPLGGSSNHFRTAVLREIGAWDPYNVTEDADLGMRLSRFGYRCEVAVSTTYEEAPARFGPWLRQRTRWFKGWMQTWLVHMRTPLRLLANLGMARFAVFQLVVGGNVLAALVYPLFLGSAAWQFSTHAPAGTGLGSALLFALHGTALSIGFAIAGLVGWVGLTRRGLAESAWIIMLPPIHWLLLSLAAWRAIYQLLRDPYRWEKTEHGLARTSRLARERALTPVFPKKPKKTTTGLKASPAR